MKRCPLCNKVTEDESQSFCLDDGTPLERVSGSTYDSAATLVSPNRGATGNQTSPPTIQANVRDYGIGSPSPGSAPNPSWQPSPGQNFGSGAPVRKSKAPWIIGAAVVAVFLVSIIGAAAFIAVKMTENTNKDGSDSGIKVKSTPAAPAASPSKGIASSSPSVSPESDDQPPADTEKAKADLVALEKEWTQANIDGDKAALERILASDFTGTSSDGTTETKKHYLKTITPDKSVKSFSLDQTVVNVSGTTGVVTGVLNWVTKTGTQRYRYTDTFIWRDGRWQAIGSQSSAIK